MVTDRLFLGVGDSQDATLGHIMAAVARTGIDALRVEPEALGDHSVTVGASQFHFDDREVAGIVFRCEPHWHFSSSFRAEDQLFADVEARAVWLAGLNLEGVFAVNRQDAVAWFDDSKWGEWRRMLASAGVPMSPLRATNREIAPNERWLPFRSTRLRSQHPPQELSDRIGVSLLADEPCARNVIAGKHDLGTPLPAAAQSAADLLRAHGVQLAEITTDCAGRVCWVDLLPDIERNQLGAVVDSLMEAWDEHLHHR